MSEAGLRKRSAKAGLDQAKVEAMFDRAQRTRGRAGPSRQLAIARNGKIGAAAAFGEAVQGESKSPPPTIRSTHSLAPGPFSAATWL